jgi:hypothetical protein
MELWTRQLEGLTEDIARGAGRLVARVAISGDERRPIHWVQETFLLGIVDELEQSGVSRKVAADMLGVTRRTLSRQMNAAQSAAELREGSTWARILEAISQGPIRREELLGRFRGVESRTLASILLDMVECGVIEEDGGLLRRTSGDGEAISDEQIRRYLAIARALRDKLSADEVAEELGVEEARVESFMASLGDEFSLSPVDEGRWLAIRRLLAFFIDLLAGKIDADERFKATLWLLNVSALDEASREELRNSLQRAKKIVSEAATKHANPALHWPEDAIVWCAAHLFSEIARLHID